MDGLETLFSQTLFTCARAVLKAFNNRKYIYLVTLKLDYNLLKEQEKKAAEERGMGNPPERLPTVWSLVRGGLSLGVY